MKIHKCYFCNFQSRNLTDLRRHVSKKTKCSYLLRTCNITIENMDDYNKYVELHKSDPENEIWGIDYKNLPKVKYYDSDDELDEDEEDENKKKYNEFMENNVYNKMFECENCGKSFNRKDNLKRHYISCNKKKELLDGDNDIGLKKKILLLEKEIKNLKNGSSNNIENSNNTDNSVTNSYNNITNNNITNNTIVLKLNNYGEEEKDIFLDKERMLMYFNEPFTAIPDIIKKIHFTPNKRSENTNIRINNISNGKIQIYKNEWKTRMKKGLIRELIREYGTELGPIYEKYQKEGIIEGKINKFERFWQKLDKEDEEFMKEQEQQVDCMLIDCCKKHKTYLNNL